MSNQTHLGIPQCPNGHGDMKYVKNWLLKAKGFAKGGKRANKETGCIIELWTCLQCRAHIRRPKKLPVKET